MAPSLVKIGKTRRTPPGRWDISPGPGGAKKAGFWPGPGTRSDYVYRLVYFFFLHVCVLYMTLVVEIKFIYLSNGAYVTSVESTIESIMNTFFKEHKVLLRTQRPEFVKKIKY